MNEVVDVYWETESDDGTAEEKVSVAQKSHAGQEEMENGGGDNHRVSLHVCAEEENRGETEEAANRRAVNRAQVKSRILCSDQRGHRHTDDVELAAKQNGKATGPGGGHPRRAGAVLLCVSASPLSWPLCPSSCPFYLTPCRLGVSLALTGS
jgi:hypothetical protein